MRCLLLITILFLSCDFKAKEQKSVLNEIMLIKSNEITLEFPNKDFLVGSIRVGFHTNADNTLFAFEDHTLMQIIISDSTGRVISKIGGKGRGPKELLHITNAGFNKNNEFIIYDARQFLFKVFDIKGNITNTFELESNTYHLTSRNLIAFDSSYFFGIYEIEYLNNLKQLPSSNIIAKISHNGKNQITFGNYDSLTPKSSLRNFNPTKMAFNKKTNIAYEAQKHSYIIQGWNLKTYKREIVIAKKPPNFHYQTNVFDRSWSRKRIIEESVGYSNNTGVFLTNNYILLSYVTRESISGTDYSRYIAVYDYSGNYIGEKQLPNKLLNVINNQLYVLQDENPANYTIDIYEITLD